MHQDRVNKYKEVLETLLNSEGFNEELENANYHSAGTFLKEMLKNKYYESWK